MISFKKLKLVAAGALLAVVLASLIGAFSPDTYPVTDLMSFNAVGDGVFNNNTAFAQAATAVANGGKVRMPCGTFLVTATPSFTIADKKHLSLIGDGSDCATILVSGPVNGPTITLAGGNASFDIEGFTIATTQAGGQVALTTQLTNGTGDTFGPNSTIRDVFFRPSDMYQTNPTVPSTTYWGYGWNNLGVNNVNVFGGGCVGGNNAAIDANNFRTICNQIAGSGFSAVTQTPCIPQTGLPGCYAVVTNFFGFIASGCIAGILVNDWYQGLSAINVNATLCQYGIYQQLVNPVGALTEIQVIGGQYANTVGDIVVNDKQFAGLYVNGTLIDVVSGTGIIVNGTQYTISANTFGCNTPVGTIALSIAGSFAQGGTIGNNVFPGSCGEGIDVGANVTTSAVIANNHFVSNGYASFTATIDDGSGGNGNDLTVSGYTAIAPLTIGACVNGPAVGPGTCIASQVSGTAGGDGVYAVGAAAFTGAIAGTTLTTSAYSGPPLIVGSYVNGSGVTSGTKITAILTGVGFAGTYTVNNSLTISAEAMTSAQLVTSETMSAQWLGPSPFDYVFHSGAGGTTITDREHRLLSMMPPCNASDVFSEFVVVDSAVSTFGTTITGGGVNNGIAFCDFHIGAYTLH